MKNHRFILGILDELAATTKKNEKLAILTHTKNGANNKLFKEVLVAAYDPLIAYNIKKIPDYKKSTGQGLFLSDLLVRLKDNLAGGLVTGHAAIDELTHCLEMATTEDAEIIERVIARNLKCGISAKSINKVWPGLIREYPVMLCSKLDEKSITKIEWPAYGQHKMDGMRANIIIGLNDVVEMYTRNGKKLEPRIIEHFRSELAPYKGSVLDGELLAVDNDGEFLARKTSNGICNKALRGTIQTDDIAKLVFVIWDAFPVYNFTNSLATANTSYESRWEWVNKMYALSNTIRLVESTELSSFADAEDLFEQVTAAGGEGIVIKNKSGQWEPKRVNHHIKMKNEHTADLRVVSVKEGAGKYKGFLGSLECESEDGIIKVSVGSGFSDKQRTPMEETACAIGQIVEVKYNEQISTDNGEMSLFLPIFLKFRADKDTANTADELD